MPTNSQMLKWKIYKKKSREMLLYGLKHGYIRPYDAELIEKLRTIYYGGIPASILLLSDYYTNGHCYDRAVLLSRAFLDTEDDINVIDATIDGIKLNPEYLNDEDPLYADHCFLERTTKDGKKLIYDTSSGFVYDKRYYWLMEHPKVRHINSKQATIDFVNSDEERHPSDIEKEKISSIFVLPIIEKYYGKPYEMYSAIGIEILQREVELFKKKIKYDEFCEQIEHEMEIAYAEDQDLFSFNIK